MVFGLIADVIASCTTILLPCYLSYKALRSGDPAATTPWLIYFVMLSLALLFESWTVFIIGWMPFYSWIRLFFLLYLVLPQTQGAKHLYLEYVEPYIVGHENRIDQFIGETHQRLQELGLGYLGFIVDWLRDKVLGQQSPQGHHTQAKPHSSTAPGSYGQTASTYASDLLARFAMPAARTHAAQSSGLASLLQAGLSAIPGASSGGAARSTSDQPLDLSHLDSFLGSGASNADKSSAIQSQKDKLQAMLKALDREQQNVDLAYGSGGSGRPPSSGSGFGKSRSEVSFENVSYEEARVPPPLVGGHGSHGGHGTSSHRPGGGSKRQSSGGWFGLGGGSGDKREHGDDHDSTSQGWTAARDVTEAILSSGVDRDHR